jgi:hypothetical protein
MGSSAAEALKCKVRGQDAFQKLHVLGIVFSSGGFGFDWESGNSQQMFPPGAMQMTDTKP